MLDLKSKLLAAGLVTEAQVKKVEDEQAAKNARKEARAKGGKGAPASPPKDPEAARREEQERWRKRLDELKAGPKSEQYDVVRGWVERHRLDDKTAVPSENASRFHFARADDSIGHVTLEPEVKEKLAAGEAGIIAFMGHNGLEHAVVPVDLARDVLHVKPEWVRALAGVTDQAAATPSAEAASPPADEPGPEG